MVKIKKATKNFEEIDKSITKKMFLSSILSWYPQGVQCHVEKVSKVLKDKFSKVPEDRNISIIIKIDDMEKCRMRELDDEGKPIQVENEYGEKQDKIIVGDATGKKVSLFFKLKLDEEDTMGDLFHVSNMSAFYPLINYGCIKKELVPEDNTDGFAITHEEIVNALEDLSFIAKSEQVNQNNSKFKAYNKLICE